MKLTLLTLLTALATSSAEVDVHVCACEAEEFGYTIDCAAEGAMLDALNYLKSNGCATDCMAAECEKNYLIVQTHHDYCPEADIPEAIEDGFHDYDESCTACAISRAFTPGAPDCPAAVCTDNSGNDAYTAMAEAGCKSDCSSDECQANFLTLRVVHDDCAHDTLSKASEDGIHDMEVACAAVLCNVVAGEDKQLECTDDHDGHDHGEEEEDSHDGHDHGEGEEDSHDDGDHADGDHADGDHADEEKTPEDTGSGAATATTAGAAALIGAIMAIA